MDNIENFVGQTVLFYGVDCNRFKIGVTAGMEIDHFVLEAIEDESDGYRSMLYAIPVVENAEDIFPLFAVAKVTIESVDDGYFCGYRFFDVTDKHLWLEIGTSDWNDYYPYFTFNYQPKAPRSERTL